MLQLRSSPRMPDQARCPLAMRPDSAATHCADRNTARYKAPGAPAYQVSAEKQRAAVHRLPTARNETALLEERLCLLDLPAQHSFNLIGSRFAEQTLQQGRV